MGVNLLSESVQSLRLHDSALTAAAHFARKAGALRPELGPLRMSDVFSPTKTPKVGFVGFGNPKAMTYIQNCTL